jgi:hypothetical protein
VSGFRQDQLSDHSNQCSEVLGDFAAAEDAVREALIAAALQWAGAAFPPAPGWHAVSLEPLMRSFDPLPSLAPAGS